jgi:hypothetical protein
MLYIVAFPFCHLLLHLGEEKKSTGGLDRSQQPRLKITADGKIATAQCLFFFSARREIALMVISRPSLWTF